MVPTNERNHLSVAFEYEGNIFLFDCGEATQHQIKRMKLPIGKIKRIFISHWHADHTIGLIGLIQTLSNTQGIEKIEIHGPKDSKKYIDHMLKSTIFEPRFEIEVNEHNPQKDQIKEIISTSNYKIYCAKLNHGVPCIGYRFEEKDVFNINKEKAKEYGLEQSPLLARAKMGMDIQLNNKTISHKEITYTKKGLTLAFIFDTRPCNEISLLAENVDHLIMEATFLYSKHHDKAEEYDHMSAKETAQIAKDNNVKHLIITHFSQRYKDTKEIEEEAKEIFENTTSTYDLMTLPIKKN